MNDIDGANEVTEIGCLAIMVALFAIGLIVTIVAVLI